MRFFFYAFLALVLLVILSKLAPSSMTSEVFNSATGEWEVYHVQPSSH
jgi:hypothetical protein